MSYIRSKDTYCYDTDEGLIIHTNCVVKQDPLNDYPDSGCKRYIVTIPKEDFTNMVREILRQTAPPWARNRSHINEIIKRWKKERAEI